MSTTARARQSRFQIAKLMAVCCLAGWLLGGPAVLNAATEQARSGTSLPKASSLEFSRVGKSKVPVFSSVDGYVCFFLTADVIRPAKRKMGVFSVPKHGLAVGSLGLDFRQAAVTGQDWSKIISLVEPLQQMELIGAIRLRLPGGEREEPSEWSSTTMPLVHRGEIHLNLLGTSSPRCVLSHDVANNQIHWQFKP